MLAFPIGLSIVQCKSENNYQQVALQIKKVIEEDKNIAPTLIRLAWHSSGTYSVFSKTGGSNGGTIRLKEELSHGANAGLAKAVKILEKIHNSNKNTISFADLITLAGVVAVKECNGPTVNWRSGRVDSPIESTPVEGRLPGADQGTVKKTNEHIRDVFGKMGFDDREIVTLSGAHALGRCHPNASG